MKKAQVTMVAETTCDEDVEVALKEWFVKKKFEWESVEKAFEDYLANVVLDKIEHEIPIEIRIEINSKLV